MRKIKLQITYLLSFFLALTFNSCKTSFETVNNGVNKSKTNTYMVEYDFLKGTYDQNNLKIKSNTPTIFKIKNINRLAYKVEIFSKDSLIGYSDFSDVYELFKKEEKVKVEEQLKDAEVSFSKPTVSAPVYKSDLAEKDAKYVEMVNTANKNLLNKISHAFTAFNENKKISIDSLFTEIKVEKELEQKIPYHFETQNELASLYLKTINDYNTIIDLSKDYLIVSAIVNDPLLTSENLETQLEKVKNAYTNFEESRKVLNNFSFHVLQFRNLYSSLKSNPELSKDLSYGTIIKLNQIADNQNRDIDSMHEQVEKIDFNKLKEAVTQVHQLLNSYNSKNSVFEYVSYPIQPYQDVAVFDIKIHKKEKNNVLFYDERKFSHKEFTKHGIRLDASIGFAGSIHSKNFSYDLQYNNKKEQIIVNQDKSRFSPSFVGFFTASYRSASHFTGGLSFGLGISADKGALSFDNFFIGPSLMIGKYERITLTSGVSLKNLPRLNEVYKEGDVVPNEFKLDNVTTKSYQPGFFVSVSYNLTKGVKDNIKGIKSFL